MKKKIFTYGLISGLLCSAMMAILMPFQDRIGFDKGELFGYTTMVLSFLLVFFGIRSYRNQQGDGQITFAKAFGLGISITLITCLFYVATWEVMYFAFMPDFIDKYSAYEVAKARASGASEARIAAQIEQIKKYKAMYDNPFFNAAITFVEPFPVGLGITVISAAILRRRPRSGSLMASEASGA